MFTLPSILLPIDFSERCVAASQYAVALARRFQSELHLLNVIDLRVYGMYGMGNDDAALERFGPGSRKAAEAEMGSFVPDELKNLTVKRVLLCGDPAHEIAKYAAANRISLIVMPTHGYGRFRRFLLGSVTTKVLHEVECPVWTGVHLESHPEPSDMQFRRILVALEPWKAGQALEWAWQFGREVGAQVKIVHALPPVYGPGSSYFAAEMKTHVKGAAEQAI